jgi:hypothetical protein
MSASHDTDGFEKGLEVSRDPEGLQVVQSTKESEAEPTPQHGFNRSDAAEPVKQEPSLSDHPRKQTIMFNLTPTLFGIATTVTKLRLEGRRRLQLLHVRDATIYLRQQSMVNAKTTQNLGSTASASQTPPTCPSPTAAHLTNYTVAGSEQVDSLPLDCPTLNNQLYTFVRNVSQLQVCV